MTKAHAKLSPSSSVRWLTCPGSVILAPDGGKSSKAAAEGTLLHSLAEEELTGNGARVQGKLGEVHTISGFEFEVTQEMVDAVMSYVDEARQAIGDNHYEVEVSVPIGSFTGEEGATGTADLVIFRPDELEVRDAKFGRGYEVEADGNTQGLMYALGALDLYAEGLGDIKTVRVVIHQPRLAGPKEAVYTLAQVAEWRERFVNGADEVRAAAERKASLPQDTWELIYLHPSNDGCKFCPAKATCPSLRAEVLASIEGDFEDLSKVTEPDLGQDFARIERVEAWCKAVRAEAERRLLCGVPVPGLKLVAGRRGAKRWIDENEAEKVLAELLGDSRWERSLLSPTKAAKIIGNGGDISDLTTSTEGKPSVAFASDKRPEYAGTVTAEDFDNLNEEN